MKPESEIKIKAEAKELKPLTLTRTWKPVVISRSCDDCQPCIDCCPHNAISAIDGKLKIDYNLCDGCLLCLRECETGTIKEEREK